MGEGKRTWMPDLGDGVDHVAVDGLGDQGAWGIQGDTQISGISIPEKGPPKGGRGLGRDGGIQFGYHLSFFPSTVQDPLHLLCGETFPVGGLREGSCQHHPCVSA